MICNTFPDTIANIFLVFVGGVVYLQWYKANVLYKVRPIKSPDAPRIDRHAQIERAFAPGYDPALELSKRNSKQSKDALFDEDVQVEEAHLR